MIAELSQVSFRYGRREALSDLSVSFVPGITGLLGPNGAGKSTLLGILATLSFPQSGSVNILGENPADSAGREVIRAQIGVLPQTFTLVGWMRVLDTVAYAAWTHGVPNAQCVPGAELALSQAGVGEDLWGRRAHSLSGGERQKVGIASAIAHRPRLLLLDEPTVGLDPVARMDLRRVLMAVGAHTSIISSTHLIEDVARVADDLVVLSHGKLLYQGRPGDLISGEESATEVGSALEVSYEELLREGRS